MPPPYGVHRRLRRNSDLGTAGRVGGGREANASARRQAGVRSAGGAVPAEEEEEEESTFDRSSSLRSLCHLATKTTNARGLLLLLLLLKIRDFAEIKPRK